MLLHFTLTCPQTGDCRWNANASVCLCHMHITDREWVESWTDLQGHSWISGTHFTSLSLTHYLSTEVSSWYRKAYMPWRDMGYRSMVGWKSRGQIIYQQLYFGEWWCGCREKESRKAISVTQHLEGLRWGLGTFWSSLDLSRERTPECQSVIFGKSVIQKVWPMWSEFLQE